MIEDFFDNIDRLRIPDPPNGKNIEARPEQLRPHPENRWVKGEFLKGPIPLTWLSCAAELPGKAPLAVALAIMFEVGRRRSSKISLTTRICERFYINRKSKYRGIELLEKAKLIQVTRRPRKNPIVIVCE